MRPVTDTGVIDHDAFAATATQQIINRLAGVLTENIPQGDIADARLHFRVVEDEVLDTRLDFLEELKEQTYTNLRDLNFEYQAGKYPQEDYAAQRAILEKEAATVLAEMDSLSGHAAS